MLLTLLTFCNLKIYSDFLKTLPNFKVLNANVRRAPHKLPMRQRPPGHKASPPPAKKNQGLGCCSGHFVVIWIILGIVTFGVLLGVVLKFTVS